MDWPVGDVGSVSGQALCLPRPRFPMGGWSSGLQRPLSWPLDTEDWGPTVPPGVGPEAGRRLPLTFTGFFYEDSGGDKGSPTPIPPGLGIRWWPPSGPGWADYPPQSITLGFFQAQLGCLASPPGAMFFVPILPGPEGDGMGLQGGRAGGGMGRESIIQSLPVAFPSHGLS